MDAPRDDLYRAVAVAPELRVDAEGDGRTLFGHFAVFNRWTEIHSWFEGDFMERLAPGTFSKTMAERKDLVKVLFNHGHDPSMGERILATIADLREDGVGAAYEARLLSAADPILDGLREGVYGASFRFAVIKDEWNDEPGTSEHNPKGLPERTIREVRLYEFGPVTFPAYDDATAGVRSLSDRYHRDLRTQPGTPTEPQPPAVEPPVQHSPVIPHTTRRERLALIGGRLHKETKS